MSMVDVVIVNWNAGEDLGRCVAALAAIDDRELIRRVTVVDNGSDDGSLNVPMPTVDIERAGGNLGFARACNRGAARGTAPYLLFLNPDTVVHAGAIRAALAAFGGREQVGIAGVRLIDEAGRTSHTCSRFPTPLVFPLRALALDRLPFGRRFGAFMTDWAHDGDRIVDQVMGAFLMIRRDLFDTLGGFDERFFVYYEDVDLALRARRLGWASYFTAGGIAFHRGGGGSRRVPGRRLAYSLHSRLAYARKHYGIGGQALVFATTLLVEPWSRLAMGWRAPNHVLTGYALLCRRLITGRWA